MAKINLPDIASQFASQEALNDRFNEIERQFNDNVLYRDNPVAEPNEMRNDLDMNLNDIINIQSLIVDGVDLAEAVRAPTAPDSEWGDGINNPITAIRFKQMNGDWGAWEDIRGYQGLVGPKGDQGIQGTAGTDGVIGVDGAQGIQGEKGDKGDTGDTGADSTVAGPQGIQGEKGDKGDTGDTGAASTIPGPQGIQGIQGNKGDTGATGPQGIQGVKGDTGPAGADGTDGIDANPYDDTAIQAEVDLNTAKVTNVDHPLVETAVPVGALFTDTVYNDTAIQAEVDLNTAKVSNVAHPLVETAVPVGAVFTDTVYNDTTIQAAVDLNTAKVTNVDHPLVETAVPVGAVFTDTVYDDTTISAAVALNTAKVTNVDHPLVETAVPVGAVFTDTVYTLPFTDNSANWNTAYSWGDHGVEGYATTTALGNYLPLTGGDLTGTLSISGQIMVSSADLQVNGFQRTGSIFLHEGGINPTTSNKELSNGSGYLKWDNYQVWTSETMDSPSSYGLNTTSAPYITDLTVSLVSGFYRGRGDLITGSPDANAYNATIQVMGGSALNAYGMTFIYTRVTVSAPKMWSGTRTGATGSITWKEIAHAGDYLPLTGGDLTGALSSTGAFTSSGLFNSAIATDTVAVGGYGFMGNRSSVYLQNQQVAGTVTIGTDGLQGAANTRRAVFNAQGVTAFGNLTQQQAGAAGYLTSFTTEDQLMAVKTYNSVGGGAMVVNSGTGDFSLRSLSGTGAIEQVLAYHDRSAGTLLLTHNGSYKFSTTATGVSVTGVVAATGGDSDDWNAAFGWGDHGAQDYIAVSPAFSGDVDTLKANQHVRIDNTATNMPFASFWTMIVAGNEINVVSQLATTYSTGVMYVRSFNTAWSSWRRVWSDADFSLPLELAGGTVYGSIVLDSGGTDSPNYMVRDSVNDTWAYMDMSGEQLRWVTRYRGGTAKVGMQLNPDTSNLIVVGGITAGGDSTITGDLTVQNTDGLLTIRDNNNGGVNAVYKLAFDDVLNVERGSISAAFGTDTLRVDSLGAVALRYAGSDKVTTTATGATITGDLTVTGATKLADGKQIQFGTDNDAELFHNGTNLYLDLNATTPNLYIRDTASTKFTFQRSTGNFIAQGNVTAYSDERLKKDIEIIPDALAKVSQLKGVTFTDKETEEKRTGLIAQDVQKVLPEAVIQPEGQEHLAVAYGNTVGLLVEAIKELKAEVEELKAKLEGGVK